MYLGIQRTYFVPGLRAFLSGELKKCMVCNQTLVKPEHPPITAMVPEKPLEIWQFDYIGPFPKDTVRKKYFIQKKNEIFILFYFFLENGGAICPFWH